MTNKSIADELFEKYTLEELAPCQFESPPGEMGVYCPECEWEGILDDCGTTIETEGFGPEMISYPVAICPKCECEVEY